MSAVVMPSSKSPLMVLLTKVRSENSHLLIFIKRNQVESGNEGSHRMIVSKAKAGEQVAITHDPYRSVFCMRALLKDTQVLDDIIVSVTDGLSTSVVAELTESLLTQMTDFKKNDQTESPTKKVNGNQRKRTHSVSDNDDLASDEASIQEGTVVEEVVQEETLVEEVVQEGTVVEEVIQKGTAVEEKVEEQTEEVQTKDQKHDSSEVAKKKRHKATANDLECDYCSVLFPSKRVLRDHLVKVHNLLHVCCFCLAVLKNRSSLQDHFSHKHLEKVKCNVCFGIFASPSSLINHKKLHLGERKFGCSECSLNFYKKEHLENHMTVHSKEKSYLCGKCGKTFSRNAHLIEHMKYMHPANSVQVFSCSECPKFYYSEEKLSQHFTAEHTDVKKYKCSSCHWRFHRLYHLRRHMKSQHPNAEMP